MRNSKTSLSLRVAMVLLGACSPLVGVAQDAAGDPEAGKAKVPLCQGCHGVNGEGMTMPPGQPSSPRLAGQVPVYFIKALNDYKNDVRIDPLMNAVAKGLTEADVANLAAYYASLK
jgi:cytochrome c553